MSLLLGLAVKSALVLLVAVAAAAALRRRSAAVRHWVLAAGVAGAVMVPALSVLAPAWPLPAPPRLAAPDAPAVATTEEFTAVVPATAAGTASGERAGAPYAALIVVALWLGGTAAALSLFAASLVRLSGVTAGAHAVRQGPAADLAAEIARAYGIRRPVRLLHGTHPALVVTWGAVRPTVLLPSAAGDWPEDRLRVVLAHELAHVQRGDWIVQMLAELLRAVYWFNPLAWAACARLRHESEQACDDAVLARGVAPPAYAAQLVDLARTCSAHRAWSPALPMARPSGLERRVHAMLDATLNRQPITRAARLGTAAAFLLLSAAAAGVGTAAQGFATVTGSLSDASGAALPGVTLSMTNAATETTTTLRSDRAGRFEFVGLPPGEYLLEAVVPGFRDHRARVTLNGEQLARDIVLEVGMLEETITVTDSPDTPRPIDPRLQEMARQRRDRRAACTAATPGEAGTPIGGNIRPPVKLRDVRPIYPAAVDGTRPAGVVRIDARIGTDGFVREMRVDPAAHPDLARAALDAVGQWQFDQTLLNCVPIEVDMKVSVTFRQQQSR